MALRTLATPNKNVGSAAAQFIASVAAIEIPRNQWPELMTSLLHKLGLSPALQIHDVYSITEPELLAFIRRPALALLLVFPVSAAYT